MFIYTDVTNCWKYYNNRNQYVIYLYRYQNIFARKKTIRKTMKIRNANVEAKDITKVNVD